ncbi:hypothetical protein RYX36_025564, partial [Vicia faba]
LTSVTNEVSLPLENGKLPVVETVIPVNHVKEPVHQELPLISEKVSSNAQEDTPKNSFASIAHAIFVVNLSRNTAVEQLDRVFKKSGSIKRNGIQVRSNKVYFFYTFPTAAFLNAHCLL